MSSSYLSYSRSSCRTVCGDSTFLVDPFDWDPFDLAPDLDQDLEDPIARLVRRVECVAAKRRLQNSPTLIYRQRWENRAAALACANQTPQRVRL